MPEVVVAPAAPLAETPPAPPLSVQPAQGDPRNIVPTGAEIPADPVIPQRENPPDPLRPIPPVPAENADALNPDIQAESFPAVSETFPGVSATFKPVDSGWIPKGEWELKDGKWVEPGPGWVERMKTRVSNLLDTNWEDTALGLIKKAVTTGQIYLVTVVPPMDSMEQPIVPPSEASRPGQTKTVSGMPSAALDIAMPQAPIEPPKPAISDTPMLEGDKNSPITELTTEYTFQPESIKSVPGFVDAQIAFALTPESEWASKFKLTPEQIDSINKDGPVYLNLSDPDVNFAVVKTLQPYKEPILADGSQNTEFAKLYPVYQQLQLGGRALIFEFNGSGVLDPNNKDLFADDPAGKPVSIKFLPPLKYRELVGHTVSQSNASQGGVA